MQNVNRYNWKSTVALLLSILLVLPYCSHTGTAQTLRDLHKQNEAHARRKLAPDLEDSLTEAEERNAAAIRKTEKTLGQMRREKAQKNSLPGTWAQASTKKPERVIVTLNGLTTEIMLKSCLLRLGGWVHQLHPNMGIAAVEVPLEKVRELAAETGIDYVSPDRPIMALGHIEATTGAAQVRNLVKTNSIQDLDGTGIGIAVIDSGVDNTHKLIRPSSGHPGIIAATDFITVDGRTDRYGHGTFVASLAVGSNALKNGAYEGIAPSAGLISLKVLGDDGIGLTSSLIAAMDWCIYNKSRYNIRVINLSIGTPAKDSYLNDPLCLAARRAHAAGLLVVAAAGNEGKDSSGNKLYGGIHSPGIDPSVLTVGAANTLNTDRRSDDRIASYSSRGPTRGFYTDANGVRIYDNLIKPDLVAPGNRIIAASSQNPDGTKDLNNLIYLYPSLAVNPTSKVEDRLMSLSGTSVAAPVVAGAAALLYEINPNFTPNLVKAILMYSAQPLPGYSTLEQGTGLLNIDGAVRIARLVRSNFLTLSNGNSMLTSLLPASQSSVIGYETCYWGQGVITNYCFLYGNNLMTYWQGIYGRYSVLADATKVTNGLITQVPGFTSSGVLQSGGVVFSDGGFLGDDRLIAKGVVFSDGVTQASGVVFADGRIKSDATSAPDILVQAKVVVPGD
ncbi:MAG: S8 family serine peptidase [Acidobacteria bacterium]|nr:S8 family serine peptidase [Acidobacteriota bacterium]